MPTARMRTVQATQWTNLLGLGRTLYRRGQGPAQRKGNWGPKRDPNWTSLNVYMRQGPCTEGAGPCRRKWARLCTGEGRPGPVQGPLWRDRHTDTHDYHFQSFTCLWGHWYRPDYYVIDLKPLYRLTSCIAYLYRPSLTFLIKLPSWMLGT